MIRKEKYKVGFDSWGLILFLTIMIPNFIWFAIPAPNDILRAESVTPILDEIASIVQVVMVIALCSIVNKDCNNHIIRSFHLGIFISIFIYFVGWFFYYRGLVNPIIILDLCIAPCLAFILFSIARKNIVALTSSSIFMVCHLIYGIDNFIVLR